MLRLMRRKIFKGRRGKGFTLVELLVVVAIIMILAAVLMPRFLGYTDRARQARAVSDLGTMKTIVEVYTADEGQGAYPSTDPAADNYVGKILQSKGVNFKDKNSEDGIKDPWGFAYIYTVTTDSDGQVHYIIASPGKDGQFNTADDVFTTDQLQPAVGAVGIDIDVNSDTIAASTK